MRLLKHRFISLVLIVVFVLSLAVPMVRAQDEMSHSCDSTTILLLFIAEYEYGFHSMMDVATFEKGQYTPLFDAMMAMMEEGEMMEEDAMMEEDEMMEEDAMMDESMMLMAPMIADEDPACTDLRAEVEAYIYKHFSTEMMMMKEEG